MENEATLRQWRLYTDGASDRINNCAALGVALYKPGTDKPVVWVGKRTEYATSHEAEYHAVIHGLAVAKKSGAAGLQLFCDCEIMIKQLRGECKVNAANLKPIHESVLALIGGFRAVGGVQMHYVPRAQNAVAHKLANDALTTTVLSPVLATTSSVVAPPAATTPPVVAPHPSSNFYKPVGDEIHLWSGERLWQIARTVPTECVPVADLADLLDAPGWFGSEPVTVRRVAEWARQTTSADDTKPVLLHENELLDGRFRLAKAVCNGQTEIAVKRLKRLPAPCARYPLRYAP